MKMHFIALKKAVPIALVLALVLALSACESGKDQVTEFKIRNDRVGTEVSFNLPAVKRIGTWWIINSARPRKISATIPKATI